MFWVMILLSKTRWYFLPCKGASATLSRAGLYSRSAVQTLTAEQSISGPVSLFWLSRTHKFAVPEYICLPEPSRQCAEKLTASPAEVMLWASSRAQQAEPGWRAQQGCVVCRGMYWPTCYSIPPRSGRPRFWRLEVKRQKIWDAKSLLAVVRSGPELRAYIS